MASILDSSVRQPVSGADALVSGHGRALADALQRHTLEIFPPRAQKPLRLFTIAEVAKRLGVNPNYLRALAGDKKGPTPTSGPMGRMSYTGDQVLQLRHFLDGNARSRRYLPVRRPGEHLQIVAVANFKGGSGKTTTTAHLAQHLALNGYRVLALDLDPQASLSALHGFQPEIDVGANETLYGAIRYDDKRRSLKELIRPTNFPGLHLVPGNLELMDFEFETPVSLSSSREGVPAKAFLGRLQQALESVDAEYDVVLLDCPPQLGYLTMVALAAATSLLVPIHPQMLDVMSMAQFLQMLGDVMNHLASAGAKLNYDWVHYLIARYESSDGPQTDMVAFLRSHFGRHVLTNPMLKSVAVSDAGITKQTIYEVERKNFTGSTYDRAIEALEAVNGEIEAVICRAWGRSP